jgi:hypothetical protein
VRVTPTSAFGLASYLESLVKKGAGHLFGLIAMATEDGILLVNDRTTAFDFYRE